MVRSNKVSHGAEAYRKSCNEHVKILTDKKCKMIIGAKYLPSEQLKVFAAFPVPFSIACLAIASLVSGL